jgi:hypothetical protein
MTLPSDFAQRAFCCAFCLRHELARALRCAFESLEDDQNINDHFMFHAIPEEHQSEIQ